jgi:predicted membrane protein
MEPNEKDINRVGEMKSSRILSGAILIVAGGLYLAKQLNAPIPDWVLSWPLILIALGLLTGVKSKFRNPGALIMITVGGVFLIDRMSPELKFHEYLVPIILIAVGLIFILRPKHNWTSMSKNDWRRMSKEDWKKTYYSNPSPGEQPPLTDIEPKTNITGESEEYIEINAVFGGVKKIILSKNFSGGEINSFMGGTEINFMKADIQRTVVLEVNNVFGGTKLIVPSNWDVKNEVTAVFGGIEDKRNINSGISDHNKIMILKGTCVFGGIEVANY